MSSPTATAVRPSCGRSGSESNANRTVPDALALGAVQPAMHSLSHCATVACDAAADVAFAVLTDAAALGSWALGCWQASPVPGEELLLAGTSLFDGSTTYVRPDADPSRLVVDFAVGPNPKELSRRISARVVSGATLGFGDDRCFVTLLAWRPAGMTDERWQQIAASHEVEVLLLRARIEASA